MSLVGIDLGTSAIKVVAYAVDGRPLAAARREVPGTHAHPGHWEVDVHRSRDAFWSALGAVAADPRVQADPPRAISFSSSGREVFPVDAGGVPLGPCLMTADTRGDAVAAGIAGGRTDREWFALAGHVPRRMDPVARALWWRESDPAVAAATRWFMNWHEHFALLLTGRPVVDQGDAGTWAVYDVATGGWSAERVAETGIDPAWLPEILASGTPIGPILPDVADRVGLPHDVLVVTGAYDAFAAAVGTGAVDPGVVGLACGTWHSYTLPIGRGWPPSLVEAGVNVYPHPGPTGFGLMVTDPNGMAVIDWARRMVGLSIEDLDAGLEAAGPGPGSVSASPALTPLPHQPSTSGLGGELRGLSLATSPVDIVRALLEGIACRFADSLVLLDDHGIAVDRIRASGGGARSAWWLQLHADLAGLPVEVVAQDEPGAFGAAVLAGVGLGAYPTVSGAVASLVRVERRFDPDPARGALYAGRRERVPTR